MKACYSRSTSLAENKSETSHMYIYNKVKVLQNHETCDTIWKYKTKHKETGSRFRIQWIWIWTSWLEEISAIVKKFKSSFTVLFSHYCWSVSHFPRLEVIRSTVASPLQMPLNFLQRFLQFPVSYLCYWLKRSIMIFRCFNQEYNGVPSQGHDWWPLNPMTIY